MDRNATSDAMNYTAVAFAEFYQQHEIKEYLERSDLLDHFEHPSRRDYVKGCGTDSV